MIASDGSSPTPSIFVNHCNLETSLGIWIFAIACQCYNCRLLLFREEECHLVLLDKFLEKWNKLKLLVWSSCHFLTFLHFAWTQQSLHINIKCKTVVYWTLMLTRLFIYLLFIYSYSNPSKRGLLAIDG